VGPAIGNILPLAIGVAISVLLIARDHPRAQKRAATSGRGC
jgi:hypothetical protein